MGCRYCRCVDSNKAISNTMNEDLNKRIEELERKVAELSQDKLAVNMTYNADQNIYRSLQRTLVGRVNLGIGTSSPSTSTALDIVSTSLAFRPPCMTTAQRDAITVTSLSKGFLIYNTTTNVLNHYNGTVWGAV